MLNKIVFYLQFAKSKLNKNCIEHQEARNEIDEIINYLRECDTNDYRSDTSKEF